MARMSEVLNEIACYYLENSEAPLEGYSEEDVINATLILTGVLGNYVWDKRGDKTLDEMVEGAEKFGNSLHDVIEGYAGFSVKEYLANKEKLND